MPAWGSPRRPRSSLRSVSTDGDALDDAVFVAIVPYRVVHGGAVVPEPEIAALPPVADEELLSGCVLIEEAEDGLALLAGHAGDVAGEVRIDEQVAPAGLGVGPHDGVFDRFEALDTLAFPLAAA